MDREPMSIEELLATLPPETLDDVMTTIEVEHALDNMSKEELDELLGEDE